jgi:hypothetical protein
VQCAGCNVFRQGEQFIFSKNLDLKYGKGTAENLQIQAGQIIKLSDSELQEMIKDYEKFVKTII